jgi:Ca2+/Na+ antiporter
MIKIRTKWIPPKGYHAVTIWPFLFFKGELTKSDIVHESVHERQYLFCLFSGFAVLGLKYVLFGTVLNWLFIPLPFVLFYIIYAVGYFTKGYERMKIERNAYDEEKKIKPKAKNLI